MPSRARADSNTPSTDTDNNADQEMKVIPEADKNPFLTPSDATNRNPPPGKLSNPSSSTSSHRSSTPGPSGGLKLLIPSAVRRSFESTSENQNSPSNTTNTPPRSSFNFRRSPTSETPSSRSRHTPSKLLSLWNWKSPSRAASAVDDGDRSVAGMTDGNRSVTHSDVVMATGDDEACFMGDPVGNPEVCAADLNLLTMYPYELLVKIFTFLPLEDILNLRLVSKYIETMTHENAIWKSLYYAEKGWKIYEPPVPEIRESSRRMSTPWHGPNWISKGKAAVFDRPASPSNMITSFKDTVKITETTVHSPMKGIETASKKENLESPISPCYQDLISQPINWTQVYMERTILEKRWLEGEATSSICFSAHTEAIYCCQLIHERIITGSRDKTVKFWSTSPGSAEPPALVYSINDAHTMSVLCLQVDPVGGQEGKGFMVTGSSDATVGVWDLKGVLLLKPGDKCKNKPKKIKTLNGHDGGVLDIVFNEEKILSCSKDETVRIWNRSTLESTHVLKKHLGSPVNCVAIHPATNNWVSAAGNGRINLWDLTTGKYVRTLRSDRDGGNGQSGLACVGYKAGLVIYGASDKTLVVMNASTREIVKEWHAHKELVRAIAFNEDRGILCSVSYDETVKLWNSNDDWSLIAECDVAHAGMVFAVAMNATQIVSTSHDNTMAVQDFAGGLKYAALFA